MVTWGTVTQFGLAAGGVISLITLWLLIHQKRFSIFTSLFAYLNALFFIEIMATVIIASTPKASAVVIAHGIRVITALYIPAILFSLIFNRFDSTFSKKHIAVTVAVWGSATLLALPLVNGTYFSHPIPLEHFSLPEYSSYYWLIIAYLGMVFFFSALLLYRGSHLLSPADRRLAVTVLFPFTIGFYTVIHILPVWGIFHPVFLLLYPTGALIIFYSMLHFRLLESSPRVQFVLPFLLLFTILLAIFYIVVPPVPDYVVHFAIVVFTALTIITGTEFTLIIHRQSTESQAAAHQTLEKQLATFSAKITTYLEPEKFWEYVGHFCHSTFGYNRCAIVTFQYDVQPYRIAFISGFETDRFQSMLTGNPSVILDELERQRQILSVQQYPPGSVLHDALTRMGIEIIVPIFEDKSLAGIIFLGGEGHSPADIKSMQHRLSLFANHVAIAYKNLKIIRQTMQAQKMAEIGMLASQLAHDFQSFISLVKLENADNPRLAEHAQYMEKLVSDLLQFVRPQELRLTPVNINDLIDMTLDVLNIPPDVILEKHYAEELPEVKVDISEMRRVFMNLLENSLRAMQNSSHKRIKITTRRLRPISRFQLSPWLYIEILDEGEGIPEEYLDKIFDPFFTTYKHRGGNGLGLAIVKQIVTRHQGYIDVASRPGKGTIFSIRIPFLLH